jgi:hypothetical protein
VTIAPSGYRRTGPAWLTVERVTARLASAVALSALLAGAAVVGIAPDAAHAQNRNPCVSKQEYRHPGSTQTKADLEKQWGVRGLGTFAYDTADPEQWFSRRYPACGYSRDEAYVEVWFSTSTRKWHSMTRYVAPDATLHGQP